MTNKPNYSAKNMLISAKNANFVNFRSIKFPTSVQFNENIYNFKNLFRIKFGLFDLKWISTHPKFKFSKNTIE